ncbi:hypothetical protein [Mycobacterium intracellulare]|nr:hypothetical protein [Mycobacterium intracellulare]
MGDQWQVILSAEVTRWYQRLSIRELAQADQPCNGSQPRESS